LTLPNFFLVGAPKAATTSIFAYLGQHPQIYISPIKEPCYFAGEVRPENFGEEMLHRFTGDQAALQVYLAGAMEPKEAGFVVLDWDDYQKLFAKVRDEKAIGEASVNYLWSATAAANIAARIPDARILMMLRDPADRAFSQYLHVRTGGFTRYSFRDEIRYGLENQSKKLDQHNPFLEFGCYYRQIKRYLDLFPRENIHIAFYEDFRRDPAQCMAGMLSFLGVDSSFAIDFAQRHNQPRVPRFRRAGYFLKRLGIWHYGRRMLPARLASLLRPLALEPRQSLVMSPEDRQYLVSYYREDIRSLAELLGRDLSAWLQ
jgi:hypothetical protein